MLFALAIFLLLASAARAHSWYEPYCCDDRDCRPALPGEVIPVADGWLVTEINTVLAADDHRLRKSQDGRVHICWTPTRWLQCLYVPTVTM